MSRLPSREVTGRAARVPKQSLKGWRGRLARLLVWRAHRLRDQGNYGEAARRAERAAALGSIEAQHLLGEMFESGRGVLPDRDSAVTHYTVAAKAGHLQAQFALARLLIGPLNRATAAPTAAEGRQWLGVAAGAGHLESLTLLGYMRVNGIGGPQDIDGGVKCLGRAAGAGQAQAQLALGLLHASGGIEGHNMVSARRFLERAAEQNVVDAMYHLAQLMLSSPEPDPAAAIPHLEKAAQHRHRPSMLLLASLYEQRQDLAPDPWMAGYWRREAGREAG